MNNNPMNAMLEFLNSGGNPQQLIQNQLQNNLDMHNNNAMLCADFKLLIQ